MARSPALTVLCVAAAACCLSWQCSRAFLPAPQAPAPAQILRGSAAAAGAVAAAGLPGSAQAFYYDGKEYFDIFFGISPLAWAFTAFAIVFFGAVLKNAALKYNKPFGTTTLKDPAPPKAGGNFVGMEVETGAPDFRG
mmetsp:Transcript_21457/g.66929  ORF Transcript_21457/g.66929 Transcript_21457/m.66929 type:complete len:138 (-) Transcript_21457:7-420(-)